MKPKLIGTFRMGAENVQLYCITNDSGGSFSFQPTDAGMGKIEVSLEYEKFEDVISVLLHEAHEYSMTRHIFRFESCNRDFARSHASYIFLMDHQQFTAVCNEVAWFITPAIPIIKNIWQKERAKFYKRKKKR